MPSPIASFGYKINGLTVNFNNLSLNTDDNSEYQWDFGDGNFSTERNPQHDFINKAYYEVTLTVTNTVDDNQLTDSLTTVINLTGQFNNQNIFNNIPALIDLYSPTEILGSIKNNQQKEYLIAKWQMYIQPLIDEPIISIDDIHNPTAWPPLVNSLISKLVVIDIINMESSSMLLNNILQSNNINNSDDIKEGKIKTIETGPAKTEYYDSQNSSENLFNLARAYSLITKPGGVLDNLIKDTCQDSQRLMIYLPMCGPLPNIVLPLDVTKGTGKPKYNSNPFGITPRMK